uniref:Uncharacterized protein n=1 Tax=Cannabis sativa TaxID=3483 RepID=A0A803QQ61_CANSA
MKKALKYDEHVMEDWEPCHPNPMREEEERVERFTTTYPDKGAPGASTSERVKGPYASFIPLTSLGLKKSSRVQGKSYSSSLNGRAHAKVSICIDVCLYLFSCGV